MDSLSYEIAGYIRDVNFHRKEKRSCPLNATELFLSTIGFVKKF